jgi:hypothetical protein
MVLRRLLDRRSHQRRLGIVHDVTVRPLGTLIIGIVGGLVVGMTSVGAGSLIIVLLMFLYPTLAANQLVGTDLTQAIPLTAAAALGALTFGHIEVPVTTALIVGGVPGVLVGSLASSRVPDGYLRPAIVVVILASGLKYVGVGTRELGLALLPMLAALAAIVVVRARRGREPLGVAGAEQNELVGANGQRGVGAGNDQGFVPGADRAAPLVPSTLRVVDPPLVPARPEPPDPG